jgi:hypothetical protein
LAIGVVEPGDATGGREREKKKSAPLEEAVVGAGGLKDSADDQGAAADQNPQFCGWRASSRDA